LLIYTVRRLISVLPVLLIITFVSFALVTLLPGDVVTAVYSSHGVDVKTSDEIRQQLGLDKPVAVRYVLWLGELLRGNLGRSLITSVPIAGDIAERMVVTGMVTVGAIVLSLLVGLPLGILVGIRPNSVWDRACTVVTSLSIAVPSFWLGMLMLILFAQRLQWLPAFGFSGPGDGLGKMIGHLILPMLALALARIAEVTRQVRSGMIDVLSQDYVRTARAKGLGDRIVLWKHAARNVLIPVVALTALSVGQLIGGAVVTESVFSVPGIGLLAISAVNLRDFPTIQGVMLVTGIATLLAAFVADIFYALLDPRIRYS